ncbi:MAG: iron chaperone, partial [Jiangellaceae bacterium]
MTREAAAVARTKDDPVAVDEYLAQLSPDQRAVLEELRQLIKSSVPGVRERISYGTSVIFALHGDLVGFVAQPNHLSFFTMSPGLAKAMKVEITKTHKVSGATIHFTPENPL